MRLKALARFFTDVDGALPTAGDASRGVIAIKRAAAAEDEVHIGLRDASGGAVWRQFLTKAETPADYTATNVTEDRTFNANSTTTDELADVLGTLIADLQALRILQ